MAAITFTAGVDPNNAFLNIPGNIDSVIANRDHI